jgi:hypothetical protein
MSRSSSRASTTPRPSDARSSSGRRSQSCCLGPQRCLAVEGELIGIKVNAVSPAAGTRMLRRPVTHCRPGPSSSYAEHATPAGRCRRRLSRPRQLRSQRRGPQSRWRGGGQVPVRGHGRDPRPERHSRGRGRPARRDYEPSGAKPVGLLLHATQATVSCFSKG